MHWYIIIETKTEIPAQKCGPVRMISASKERPVFSIEVFGMILNAYSPRFLFSGFRYLATQIPALTEGPALRGFYQWGKHLPESEG